MIPKAKFYFRFAKSAMAAMLISLLAMLVSAQSVSPEALEQFRNLPRAQQEAIARQNGLDLDEVLGSQSSSTVQSTVGQAGEQLQPEAVSSGNDSSLGLLGSLSELQALPLTNQRPERYGIALFNDRTSAFTPVDDALVPAEYKLGPGDTLNIQLFGKENEQYSLSINRAGEINFPRFGPISVAGLSFEKAEQLIQRRVSEQLIGVEAVVSLGRLRAISVFMAGEVDRPGSYAVSALSTVTQALFVAGGVSDIGSLRNIQVKRAGKTVGRFDLYDLLIKGDASGDLRLQSGDVVFVPPYNAVVEIEGAVRRPMLYEISVDETIKDLIGMSGGFDSSAYKSAAVLERRASGNLLPELKNIDLTRASDLAISLKDGDVLRIGLGSDSFENKVSLEGAVVRPGNYAWFDGMRVSNLVSSIEADLLKDVDLEYALIVRKKNLAGDVEVSQFDLGAAVQNQGSESDPLLVRKDQILVFESADKEILSRQQTLEEQQLEQEEQDRLLELGADPQIFVRSEVQAYLRAEQEFDDPKEPGTTRQELLSPILAKLRTQSRQGSPVQIVSISGAVKLPGQYPLKEGDRLFDLIRAAGGLIDSAFLGGAEFRRVSESDGGIISDFSEVSIASFGQNSIEDQIENRIESESSENILLQSRDHLTVRRVPDWTPDQTITLTGEVRFPGTYLFGKGETISDVLSRAGGITSDGSAAGALFTRESIREREAEQARIYAREIVSSYASATLTQEELQSSFPEIQQISRSLEEYEGVGRMVVDLVAILAGDDRSDIPLVDGDELHIPPKDNSVTVVGEVLLAGTHSYQSSFDVKDYLELSAGITKRADKKGIYVIKANGSVIRAGAKNWYEFTSREGKLQPGDTIVVPINSGYRDKWTAWTEISQIVSQNAFALAAILAI